MVWSTDMLSDLHGNQIRNTCSSLQESKYLHS